MEVLPKGLELDIVPADSYTESQSTPREKVDISSLPCHERSLALRKDQDSGGESDPIGDTRQVSEHHEWVMERIVLGIWARQWGRPIDMDGTEYMFVG